MTRSLQRCDSRALPRSAHYRRASARSSRRGITLIEMLVVVTGASMMLGLCVVTLQVLLRLEVDARGKLTATSSLERLSAELRADVRAAAQARIESTDTKAPQGTKPGRPTLAPALSLTMANGRGVTYQPRSHGLIRIQTDAGKTVRRDDFSLGTGLEARFEIRESVPGRFVALLIEPGASDAGNQASRQYQVLALLAKDKRGRAQQKSSATTKGGTR